VRASAAAAGATAGAAGDQRNARHNVAVLLRRAGGCALVVDLGKTARLALSAAIRQWRLASVDGTVLTHGHADAMRGLDDVRDSQ